MGHLKLGNKPIRCRVSGSAMSRLDLELV